MFQVQLGRVCIQAVHQLVYGLGKGSQVGQQSASAAGKASAPKVFPLASRLARVMATSRSTDSQN